MTAAEMTDGARLIGSFAVIAVVLIYIGAVLAVAKIRGDI